MTFFIYFLQLANCILVRANLARGCDPQKRADYKTDEKWAHTQNFSSQLEDGRES